MEQDFGKKQSKKLTVFACILSVISIGLLVFGFMAVSSNKVVMLQSLSNLSSKMDPFLEENKTLLDKIANSDNVGFKTNVKVNVDELIAEGLSFDLNLNYLENRNDQKSKLSLNLSSNGEELLGGQLALVDQKVYGFINNITPRYYYTSLEYSSFLSSLDSKDSEKVWALLKDTVNDHIDNNDIKKEKVTINYNGKDKKVNKLSYTITSKDIKEIINKFYEALKKEKTLFSNISKMSNLSEDELKNMIESALGSFTDSDDDTLVYSVYYYGFNKIVQYELGTVDNSAMIQYKTGKTEVINLLDNGVSFLSLEFTKNKKQYDFNGYILDSSSNTKLNFSGTSTEDEMSIVFNTDSGDLKLDITTNNDNAAFKYTSVIKASVSANGMSLELGTLEVNTEYYFDQKVDVSLGDSVDINEITEEDYNTIYNNFMNHPLYSIFQSIVGMIPEDLSVSL